MLIPRKVNVFFNQLNDRRNRFLCTKYLIILAFLLLALKVYNISVTNYRPYERYNAKKTIDFRKDITDRHGNILATNLVTYSLYIKAHLIENKEKFRKVVEELFPNSDAEKFKKKLNREKEALVLLERDITKQQKERIEQEGFVGVFFHEDVKRVYPHNNLFSHVIGYVDIDENGLTGIEKALNNDLLTEESESLVTSLDLDIQSIVKEEITKELVKFKAKGAVAVIMDINNGEILSLVSLPDYDPYSPWISLRDKDYNNRASLNLHEMGSTFKIFTMSLALEEGLLDLDEEFDVSQPIEIDRFTITDHSTASEPLTGREVFVKSSNIGTAQIALRLEDKLPIFLSSLNLFKPLSIEVVEKSRGREPKRWSTARKVTASYGYGVSVTVIHLMQAVASILNNEQRFHYATLIKGKDTAIEGQVVSEDTSLKIREIMQQVVLFGTGRRSKSYLYSLGGKTGTAHKVGISGYDTTRLLSSFISFFPIANPRYIIYINYDEPQGIEETYFYATGGITAAPATKRIIERIAPLLSIYPDKL
ncbi:MAG: penicillin-binding protein 2 [Rickettsiales bacterium]|jgi:cell division protein FtsI (penicillin-binding protein 3)|nr:penicillin-binding protein 2 [Rickettsiales bacterium]